MNISDLGPVALLASLVALLVTAVVLLIARREVLRCTAEGLSPVDADPEADPATDDIDAATVAVLAAAAHTALGAPVRIRQVHIHGDARSEQWSRAGRMDIMFSHRVAPNR